MGSSHGREIGPMFQENLESKFDMCNIFKPNAPLPRKTGKGFTKQIHIVIVGGLGNILRRKYYYSIENYLNFIAERTSNIDVGCKPP
jgi:hypothetical protein